MTTPMLLIQRLHHPEIALPRYATSGAAGLDLRAAIDAPIQLDPGQRTLVPTGIAIALPSGHEGQVRPRSGLALRHGITVLNAPGTVDEDYRGELSVLLINHGQDPFQIDPAMRIAQLVVCPVSQVAIREAQALNTTARGAGGYGSTGS